MRVILFTNNSSFAFSSQSPDDDIVAADGQRSALIIPHKRHLGRVIGVSSCMKLMRGFGVVVVQDSGYMSYNAWEAEQHQPRAPAASK